MLVFLLIQFCSNSGPSYLVLIWKSFAISSSLSKLRCLFRHAGSRPFDLVLSSLESGVCVPCFPSSVSAERFLSFMISLSYGPQHHVDGSTVFCSRLRGIVS